MVSMISIWGCLYFIFIFPRFYFIFILYQEIDVIQAIHQAMFLVGIDFESLTFACCLVNDCLFRQVHHYLRFRIGGNGIKQFFQERFAHHYRQYEIIQFIILVNICKETADYHAETIICNGPCCMLAATARTEVLSGYIP